MQSKEKQQVLKLDGEGLTTVACGIPETRLIDDSSAARVATKELTTSMRKMQLVSGKPMMTYELVPPALSLETSD